MMLFTSGLKKYLLMDTTEKKTTTKLDMIDGPSVILTAKDEYPTGYIMSQIQLLRHGAEVMTMG